MEKTRKTLHIVRVAFLVAIALYVKLTATMPVTTTPKPIVLYAITALTLGELGAMVVFWKLIISPSEEILRGDPQNAKALARWRSGYICIYCFSLAIAIYGLMLHFLGFRLVQVTPFFGFGAVLILLLGPRRFVFSR